ncbi:MAG: STAS domain-containing protein [Chloroflexales bacterium]|nr:STAS domain-containing protein [Chloroflexales bacterium]
MATGILVALFIQFSSSLRHLLQLTLERERQLDHLRASLETTVAERTLSLQQALVAVEQREEQLRHTLADLHDSQEATRELSAPVMPVLPGVLVAPLVGALDSGRAAMLQSNVLNAVQRERAHWVIFDVTGVPIVDTQVAQVLHQTTESIRLLGAQVLLVGIRPEVAQTLVALNISLDSITTYATLQEAVMRLAKSSDMGSSLAYWHK